MRNVTDFLGRGMHAAAIMLVCGVAVSSAKAAETVGDARQIVNTVTGSGAMGARKLGSKDPVYRNESISAASNSHGELELLDGSRIIVGEDSTISLDNFAVAGSSFSSGTIKVAKGAFRFISGGSAKEAIKIRTPLSTIGVRGTVIDIYVQPTTGVTHAVLLNGSITVCNLRRQCRIKRRTCDIIRVPTANEIEEVPFLHSHERTADEENRIFPLTGANQFRYSPLWRAVEGACFARAAESSNTSGKPDIDPPQPPAPDYDFDD